MLGISWGIVSVVVLLAYGNGFGSARGRLPRRLLDGIVISWPGQTSLQAGGERAGRRVRVTRDAGAGARELPLVKDVSPEFMQDLPIIYGNKQTATWFAAWRRPMARCAARSRSPAAASSTTRTCGCSGAWRSSAPKCSRKLFGEHAAVGQTIRVQGITSK